jgi:hypothetical protein
MTAVFLLEIGVPLSMVRDTSRALFLGFRNWIPHHGGRKELDFMLSEHIVAEPTVLVKSVEELRNFLEGDFRTSYLDTALDRLNLEDSCVEVEGKRFRLTQKFLEEVATFIQMPLRYAYAIDYGLFRTNFLNRREHCSSGVRLCVQGDVVVNLAPAGYQPAATLDLLDGFCDETFWKFEEALLSPRGVEISLLTPSLNVEPVPGDIVKLGVRLGNSETGGPLPKGSGYTLRLLCSNGAVLSNQVGTARWSSDYRTTYRTRVEKFLHDLSGLRELQATILPLYQGVTERFLSDRDFINVWRRLGQEFHPDEVDRIVGVEPEERRALQRSVRERPAHLEPKATKFRIWDLHNVLTDAAKRYSFTQRTRLEELGGELLSLN